jgi:transcriptional regulator with XRE-family HTH domain
MKTFSKRLAWLLAHEGLSRAEFAHKVGISVSSLSHLLSDRNLPGMELLMAMCMEFKGLNPSWLLLGLGEPFGLPEPPNTPLFDSKVLDAGPVKLEIEKAQEGVQELNSRKEEPAQPKSTKMDGVVVPDSLPGVSAALVSNLESDIEYVMVFYRNGMFKKYVPFTD